MQKPKASYELNFNHLYRDEEILSKYSSFYSSFKYNRLFRSFYQLGNVAYNAL